MIELKREDKIIIGKDLVPNAIEEYLTNNEGMDYYWNRSEYMDFTNDSDYVKMADIYVRLRGKGKNLSEVGKLLYQKGEKLRIPGFDRTYYNSNT